jgi:aspartate ammonia-lyase
MSEYRMETDSLGKVQIPKNALFGVQTARAIQNFRISGRTMHAPLIRAYLNLKKAAALANAATGALSERNAELIVRATDEVLSYSITEWAIIFPVDPYQAGAGTSQNMNTNEVIANVANRIVGKDLGLYAPIHPNDHVNRSQSTNDTFPTAMRLALLDSSRSLKRELNDLTQSLAQKATQWMNLPKSARTHLQDAVPMTLGQEFSGYQNTLKRLSRWIESSRDQLRELGIGGSAAGTGLNVPEGYATTILKELKILTGERLQLSENFFEAMHSQAPVAHYCSMLRLLALELTRICNDLRLLASGPMTGLSEISLPAVQPGSSIMPGKINPSILEMANQTWFSVLGYDQAIAYALQAGQLELNVMMPIMAYSALEATEITTQALATLRERCINGLVANESRLRHYFESTPQVATALSPKLGYDLTAQLVKESLQSGESVIELVRKRKLLDESELSSLLDIKTLTGRPAESRS